MSQSITTAKLMARLDAGDTTSEMIELDYSKRDGHRYYILEDRNGDARFAVLWRGASRKELHGVPMPYDLAAHQFSYWVKWVKPLP